YPYTGVLLKTVNGGQTWSEVPISFNGGIIGVWFTDENTGFVSGPHVILKTADQGATWDTVVSSYHYYRKLVFLDSLIGFCDQDDSFVKTTDGGITWTELPYASDVIYDYDFYSEDFGILAGYPYGYYAILTTADAGNNWNEKLGGG